MLSYMLDNIPTVLFLKCGFITVLTKDLTAFYILLIPDHNLAHYNLLFNIILLPNFQYYPPNYILSKFSEMKKRRIGFFMQ